MRGRLPRPWRTSGATALVVTVPEAERVVGDVRLRSDPAASAGMPAHITVLFPFLDARRIDAGATDELARLIHSSPGFEFALTAVGRFPGVLYLAPEPAEPFIALTGQVAACWPDHRPYGGAFDTVIPHLTVAHGDEEPGLADRLAAALPIAAVAEDVALFAEERGRWRLRRRFALGPR